MCQADRVQPVHPRACGEQWGHACWDTWSDGSSPRLRGTGNLHLLTVQGNRFIPAPAGNSTRKGITALTMPVHPRACGEQSLPSGCRRYTGGSSPRLRGTGLGAVQEGGVSRFIPAPAGNRPLPRSMTIQAAVHPRACGEQPCKWVEPDLCSGSSPRLRGTDWRLYHRHRHSRFIPAPAGNSFPMSPYSRSASVHPRACGEQRDQLHPVGEGAGSSPRLRGTAQPRNAVKVIDRFIPAPAGNRL